MFRNQIIILTNNVSLSFAPHPNQCYKKYINTEYDIEWFQELLHSHSLYSHYLRYLAVLYGKLTSTLIWLIYCYFFMVYIYILIYNKHMMNKIWLTLSPLISTMIFRFSNVLVCSLWNIKQKHMILDASKELWLLCSAYLVAMRYK